MVIPREDFFAYIDVDGIQVYCYDTNDFTKHAFFYDFSEDTLDFIYNTIRSIAINGSAKSPYSVFSAVFERNQSSQRKIGKEIKSYVKLFTEGLEVSIFMPYLTNVGTYKFFQKTTFQYPFIENKKECFKLIFTPDENMVKNMVSFIEKDVETLKSFIKKTAS